MLTLRRSASVGIAACLCLVACSDPSLRVDIDIAANQAENPLMRIADTPGSRGVYFVFDALTCPPSSIDAVSNAHQFQFPEATTAGMNPLQDRFNVKTNDLLPNTFYRVRMVSPDLAGNIIYEGVGDCPINISFGGENQTMVCFGVYNPASPPLCAGGSSFSQCPSVLESSCAS